MDGVDKTALDIHVDVSWAGCFGRCDRWLLAGAGTSLCPVRRLFEGLVCPRGLSGVRTRSSAECGEVTRFRTEPVLRIIELSSAADFELRDLAS